MGYSYAYLISGIVTIARAARRESPSLVVGVVDFVVDATCGLVSAMYRSGMLPNG